MATVLFHFIFSNQGRIETVSLPTHPALVYDHIVLILLKSFQILKQIRVGGHDQGVVLIQRLFVNLQ